MAHDRRERFGSARAVHVTLRVRRDVRKLRTREMYRVVRGVFCDSADQGRFRIVHYSVQTDHVHLVVEAANRACLTQAMRRVTIRLALRLNKAMGRRKGKVFAERYHEEHLRTPTHVRNTLAYVLNNRRHHVSEWENRALGRLWIDPLSSAEFFDGWAYGRQGRRPRKGDPVARPRMFLITQLWRRIGLIRTDFVPG